MPFKYFDSYRVISLKDRIDRRKETIGEFRRIKIPFSMDLFFDAVRPVDCGKFSSVGERGAYESHVKLIEYSTQKNQSILILEDDVDFTASIQHFIMPSDFDIFYGGYEATNNDDLKNSDIIGAHMMGFSATVLPHLLDFIQTQYNDEDPCPIDGAYVRFRRAFPQYKTHFAIPILAYQRPSKSDIAPRKLFDNIIGISLFISFARKLKRKLKRFASNRL